jgi:hypothetical protein
MEMGESVAVANQLQLEDKCVVCGKKHKDPKKEAIEPTICKKPGWERNKSMEGVFESGDTQRASIYPGAKFPPPYPTEGHHCVAFTSFVAKDKSRAEKDRCVRLNHFLNKVGFQVNQPANIVQLPNRHGQVAPGANSTVAWPVGVKKEYKSYWVSIDLGRPLQLHTGRHVGSYFVSSDALYGRMLGLSYDPDACETETMQEFEDNLKQLVKGTVNYAFIQVAQTTWICHPEHLRVATDLYGKTGNHSYAYIHGDGRREEVQHEGYPGTGATPSPWQKIKLQTTPF